MSMWADYIKERLGHETLESDLGFITFNIQGEVCAIEDAYVSPAARRIKVAWELMDKVKAQAKAQGVKRLVAQVWPGMPGSDGALLGLMKYGFYLLPSEGGRILLAKELGE